MLCVRMRIGRGRGWWGDVEREGDGTLGPPPISDVINVA